MISTLRRRPCKQELHKILSSRDSTSSVATSAPPSRSFLLSKIHSFLASRSSKSTGTGSGTPSTLSPEWTDLGRSQFLRHGGRLRRLICWLASETPRSPPTPRPTTFWTCGYPGSLKSTGLRAQWSDGKNPPPSALSIPSCPPPTQPLTRRPDTPLTLLS